MRLIAIFSFLCTLVAFIISLLCVFAGSKRGYLENADILTLNTSMLGREAIDKSSPTSSSSLLNSIENGIKGELNKIATDVAKELNIHDFYSAHILDYCEGYYTPSAVSNSTSHPDKNITHCSNSTGFFHFDPTAILQSELKTGINLTALHWPSAIEDAIKAVETASKVMFVTYCIGIALTGLALLASIHGILAGNKISAATNFMLAILAFFALCIASAIVTIVMTKVTNAVNTHRTDTGVVAYRGNTLLGMTWAATILVLVAGFAWIAVFHQESRKARSYVAKNTRSG